jgi:hypothetical protein
LWLGGLCAGDAAHQRAGQGDGKDVHGGEWINVQWE